MSYTRMKSKECSYLRALSSGILILLIIAIIPAINADSRTGECPLVEENRSNADHLLLSEVCVTPTAGEFIEIFNPTGAPISLENYYLADIPDYYNIVNSTPGFDSQGSGDFTASFPLGSTIAPGGYQVIAMNSTEFKGEYGNLVPNYCMEGVDSPMMNGSSGFIGGSAGLTDSGEMVVLFYWDGNADLVEDVDIVWWGSNAAYKVNKSSITIDSEYDGDGATSAYNNDASTYPSIKGSAHTSGKSFNRTDLQIETDEVANGGNGRTGHDETTENLSVTWGYNSGANPMTTVPPRSPPLIRWITQLPDGNPTPGTDVAIIANVTDDGAISSVNISISVDNDAAESHSMANLEGDDYSHTIVYNSPPMNVGATVHYNISATDDEGNVTYSENYTYTYENVTELIMIITEVMFDDTDGGDDWVELYCSDDGNESGGGSLAGWAVDDMDGDDYDEIFGNVIVNTGEVIWIHYNDAVGQDETNASDGNGDGVIDLYTGATNVRMKVQGDQVILLDPDDLIVDAVCWAFNDTLSSTTEADDMDDLFAVGQWNSTDNSSCVDSEDVPQGWSIGRSKGGADTNSKDDWYPMENPTPGSFGNISNPSPLISGILLDPIPDDGTVLPMMNITVTAMITDDDGVLSANITWTLNGTLQQDIPLVNDGAGPDTDGNDDNWTAVIPGQSEGSVAVFSIEAFDIHLEPGQSASVTITFSEPPKVFKLLISEVMFDDVDTDDDWIELYCPDDGNSGNGNYITGWGVDDMDTDPDKEFGNVSVRTNEVVLIHFNDDVSPDENDSSDGNDDGVIDLYTGASNARMKWEGDQVALYDNDGNIVDAVCWAFNNTLSAATEVEDMEELFASGQWISAENSSCVASDDVKEGWSISRIKAKPDTNSKIDWETLKNPTPGTGPSLPVPFSFNFNVLINGTEQAPLDQTFVIEWSVRGDDEFVDLANLSLYYYEDDLDGTGVFVDHLDADAEEYIWNLSGLDEGNYYLQVLVDDGILAPYSVSTSYALEIVELLPPEVESTSPTNQAKGVKIDSDIKIIFDREMDIDSFLVGKTFIISPVVDGAFALEDEVTVVFDPEGSLEFNTSYEITVEDVLSSEGAEMENAYDFSFTTEIQRLYRLSGTVIPTDAEVTIDRDSVTVEDGSFMEMLPNGTYDIVVSADGYKTHTDTFTISGKDKTLSLVELEEDISSTDVRIGPFLYKGTNEGVEGVNVSFMIGTEQYSGETDSDGYVRFLITEKEMPRGTEITAKKDGKTVSWKYGDEDALYEVFEKKSDNRNGKKTTDDGASNTALIVILVVLVALIVGVVIAIFIYLARSKKRVGESQSPVVEPGLSGDESSDAATETELDIREEELMPETSPEAGEDAIDPAESPVLHYPSGEEVVTVETSVTATTETVVVTVEETSEALVELQPTLVPVKEENDSAASKLDAVFAHFSETDKLPEGAVSDDELLDE